MNTNNWLITGGCGFIGTNLISKLRKLNINSRILDNFSTGMKKDLAGVCNFKEVALSEIQGPPCQTELIAGDIRNIKDTCKACVGIDVVVHLAANTGITRSINDPEFDYLNNITGTFNMLEGARKNNIQKFIFASSNAPLGNQTPPAEENKAPMPISPYGASKLAGEGYCRAYYHTYGLPTVILRFSNVYGPGSGHKNSVVAEFIKQGLGQKNLVLYGDGNQTRDFLYVNDLIKAVLLSAETPVNGEVFHIGTSTETKIIDLAELIVKYLKDLQPHLNPQIIFKNERTGDIKQNYAIISRARRVLGFYPEFNLEKGLKDTIKWFFKYYAVPG